MTLDTADDTSGFIYTDLLFAAREGDFDTLAKVLAAGIDPNCTSHDGWTPLLHASRRNVVFVRTLLTMGADPNQGTPRGYTPLMRAAGHGQVDVVGVLIANGADILARDHRGLSACEMAIAERQWQAALILANALAIRLENEGSARVRYIPLDKPKIVGLIGTTLQVVGGVVRFLNLTFKDCTTLRVPVWGSMVFELPTDRDYDQIQTLGVPFEQK